TVQFKIYRASIMTDQNLPKTLRQLVAKTLGTHFREVTEIIEVPTPSLGAKELLIKNKYVGINASDINCSSGRYDPTAKPPVPLGFEGLGEVVAVGSGSNTKVGQTVIYSKFGAFCDYIVLEESKAVPIPNSDPAFLTLLVSGLTASIALEKEADLTQGKTVLVTAAAGGTGQFAVQLSKLAGCHVIGTCSSDEKVEFLKSIGCDRAVNYNKEKLDDVLVKEYPKGVDVVYESIGNEILDAATKNLAVNGRLIIIGSISNYDTGNPTDIPSQSKLNIPLVLLRKSASMRGFFLMHYATDIPRHLAQLTKLFSEGKLRMNVDNGAGVPTGPFVGLEKVVDAVEYMYSKKNIGKIVVSL
ncbi:zinc-binding alcohol dehydrogenase domain-containing protein 2, partial [Biomphalaria glabrata]